MFKIRASSLHKIMGARGLGDTGLSFIVEEFKRIHYGFDSFEGNKYTEKGNQLEDESIYQSMILDGYGYEKNSERKENEILTGECDIYSKERELIIDIKNSWDIGTHPFFIYEAEKKTKKSGYDWQLWAYMWLWGVKKAEIHYWLHPTPEELLKSWENPTKYITAVNNIPMSERRTVQEITFDESLIPKVEERFKEVKEFYDNLIKERKR